MEPHDSRDLDGVIDGVARAMTSTELARDLRPAVASRMATRASGMFGWRAGAAAAAIAAVMLAVVVWRPHPAAEPSRTADVAIPAPSRTVAPVVAARVAAPDEAPASRVAHRTTPPVRRQLVDDRADAPSIVEIAPLSILPLVEDRAAAPTQARIEIAPIDVEPVRIRELGDQVE